MHQALAIELASYGHIVFVLDHHDGSCRSALVLVFQPIVRMKRHEHSLLRFLGTYEKRRKRDLWILHNCHIPLSDIVTIMIVVFIEANEHASRVAAKDANPDDRTLSFVGDADAHHAWNPGPDEAHS